MGFIFPDIDWSQFKITAPSESIDLCFSVSDKTLDDLIKDLKTLLDVYTAIRDGKEKEYATRWGNEYGVKLADKGGAYTFPNDRFNYEGSEKADGLVDTYAGGVIHGLSSTGEKAMFFTDREFGEFMRDGEHTFNDWVHNQLEKMHDAVKEGE